MKSTTSGSINYDEFHKDTTAQKILINENNFTYRSSLAFLNKFIKTNQDVLDVGCGAGTISLYIASKKNRVVGIDISKKAIKECNTSAKNLNFDRNVKFEVCDFPKEHPDNKFDLVIVMEVLEHLENDSKAVTVAKDCLKEEGILIVSVPSLNAPLYRMGFAKKFDKEVGHLRRYNSQTLSKLLEDNGLKIVEVKKTEGVVRNSLFLNSYLGKTVRFIKYFISDLVTIVDNISIKMFGESDIMIAAKKA